MVSPFTKKVIEILKRIPSGKIATYGQIAALSGNPRAARQIVRILHIYSEKENLPWHRVVNRFGQISLKDPHDKIQKHLLMNEGVKFDSTDSIDFDAYLWKP
ncbi:MAG: MGMT family protein [Deltaproteobacteria bacterium]|nr:MGMT family protein [Deltaproteobacteria bacterium]